MIHPKIRKYSFQVNIFLSSVLWLVDKLIKFSAYLPSIDQKSKQHCLITMPAASFFYPNHLKSLFLVKATVRTVRSYCWYCQHRLSEPADITKQQRHNTSSKKHGITINTRLILLTSIRGQHLAKGSLLNYYLHFCDKTQSWRKLCTSSHSPKPAIGIIQSPTGRFNLQLKLLPAVNWQREPSPQKLFFQFFYM